MRVIPLPHVRKEKEGLILQSRGRKPLGFHLGDTAIAAKPPTIERGFNVGRFATVFAFSVLDFERHVRISLLDRLPMLSSGSPVL